MTQVGVGRDPYEVPFRSELFIKNTNLERNPLGTKPNENPRISGLWTFLFTETETILSWGSFP